MRQLLILILLIGISCTPKQDKIIIPAVDDDFYHQALLRIDDDLDGDEDNLKLVQQKLYYCDLLEWPSTCLDALEELKRQKGMTPQLLDQFIIYYSRHNQYQPLLEVINRWAPQFSLEEKYTQNRILSLVKTGERNVAYELLKGFMIDKSSIEDVQFASECYLEMEDSLMASYYLSKLDLIDPTNDLVLNVYPYLLFDLGYQDQAFARLERKASTIPDDYLFHADLSNRYEENGRLIEARNKLKNFIAIDSVVYEIADLYVAEAKWDSAHQYIDLLIDRDSLDRDAWYKKARMYEDRGWLTYSLNYYNHVTFLSPGDTIASQRAALVRQKIAYLQRLKFEENQIPLPVLESKKIINNE